MVSLRYFVITRLNLFRQPDTYRGRLTPSDAAGVNYQIECIPRELQYISDSHSGHAIRANSVTR
jgi:hypothetical protein